MKSLLFTILEMAEQVIPITSKEALLWKLTHAASKLLSTDSVTVLVEDPERKDYLVGEDLSGNRLEVCTQESSTWAEVFTSGEPVLRSDEHCAVSQDTSEGVLIIVSSASAHLLVSIQLTSHLSFSKSKLRHREPATVLVTTR